MSSVVTCPSPTMVARAPSSGLPASDFGIVIFSNDGIPTGSAECRSSPTAYSDESAISGLSCQWKPTPSLPQPHHFMCLTSVTWSPSKNAWGRGSCLLRIWGEWSLCMATTWSRTRPMNCVGFSSGRADMGAPNAAPTGRPMVGHLDPLGCDSWAPTIAIGRIGAPVDEERAAAPGLKCPGIASFDRVPSGNTSTGTSCSEGSSRSRCAGCSPLRSTGKALKKRGPSSRVATRRRRSSRLQRRRRGTAPRAEEARP